MQNIIDFDLDGDIRLRCADFFEKFIVKEKLTSDYILETLRKVICYITSLFSEGVDNKWNSIFQKLLKSKSLRQVCNLDYPILKELFISLENSCKHLSYYWMQRGITSQEMHDFEDADVFLRQALAIHPNSFQVQHALAKNMMERGLYEKEKGNSTGIHYFDEGEKAMRELVESPKYSRALCYSSHSIIELKLKYINVFKPSKEQILIISKELCEILAWVMKVSRDKYINSLKTSSIIFVYNIR